MSSAQAAAEPPLPIASSFGADRYHQSYGINHHARGSHFGNSNPDGPIVEASSPHHPHVTLDHLSTTTTPAHSADVNVGSPEPAFPFVSATSTTLLNPAQPEWSVEYNPEFTQSLGLHVANTFMFTHTVLCTKFSRDGTYLAVCLQNGETHVYNVMTGHKRSI